MELFLLRWELSFWNMRLVKTNGTLRGQTGYILHFAQKALVFCYLEFKLRYLNAAVNGKLELTLLKGRQSFDTVSTSNLKAWGW